MIAAFAAPPLTRPRARDIVSPMIDHTGVNVSDYERAKQFYAQALAPLGYALVMEVPRQYTGGVGVAGFGEGGKPDFWIHEAPPNQPRVHVAFRAAARAVVDAFHGAALAAGGKDNGAPGPRPHYHRDYYGAFVLDPDGHNVEAVCHTPG